ncbi:unnamed protein product [Protopolystoma xenopodis]|uniref:Uncharacterized protein n=1 Tax=Protopolystoma xenopodis TaxID=117903 RepID=A0A3S5BYB7_9PLAT|nr:unnamed protein product [Protopolystoma xenopodis]
MAWRGHFTPAHVLELEQSGMVIGGGNNASMEHINMANFLMRTSCRNSGDETPNDSSNLLYARTPLLGRCDFDVLPLSGDSD